MNEAKKEKLIRALRLIERITRPESDDLGYCNANLLDDVMGVHAIAERTLRLACGASKRARRA